MADLFQLTDKVEVQGLDKLQSTTNQAKSTTQGLAKNLEGMTNQAASLGKANNEAARSLSSLNQAAAQTTASTQNLQSQVRELTTGLLGTSTASIALGTTL